MTIYGFKDKNVAEALRQAVVTRALQKTIKSALSLPPQRELPGKNLIVKTPSGGIAARSGTTPGSATCDVYYIASGPTLTKRQDADSNDVSVTVYNLLDQKIAGGVYLPVEQEILSGKLIASPSGYQGFKPLVRFTLSAALTTSDASKSATITNQYGPGVDNSTSITVYNLQTHTAGAYVFEGDSGDAGYAEWDSGTNYRIVQMEC